MTFVDDTMIDYSRFRNFDEFYAESVDIVSKKITKTNPSKNINEIDLILKVIIGKGAFGTVASGTISGRCCAVKIFEKKMLLQTRQISATVNEKEILNSLQHPNIIKFIGSFKDRTYLYLVMELANGGELYDHLLKIGRFDEKATKFIGAQIVLSIEYLHRLKMVHRDIKAENILFDCRGYVKLSDFGFAKILKSKTHTFCGTPYYMAPEILKSDGYYLNVDWWSLGVLMYEMTYGDVPFKAQETLEIFEKISKGYFHLPNHFSQELKDLLCGLLEGDILKRYGGEGADGFANIMRHAFFANVDWWNLFQQRLELPFVPTCNTIHSHNHERLELPQVNFDMKAWKFLLF